MNTMLLVAMIVGIAAVLTLGAVGIVKANATVAKPPATTAAFSCSSCQGKCTAEKNCGSTTCGAVNGGTCGCKAKA